jgi:coenzyme F420-reducing hydrogenase gamma subunit
MSQRSTHKTMTRVFKKELDTNLRSKRSMMDQRCCLVGNRGTACAGFSSCSQEKEGKAMMQVGPTGTQLLFRGLKLTLFRSVLDHLNGSTD